MKLSACWKPDDHTAWVKDKGLCSLLRRWSRDVTNRLMLLELPQFFLNSPACLPLPLRSHLQLSHSLSLSLYIYAHKQHTASSWKTTLFTCNQIRCWVPCLSKSRNSKEHYLSLFYNINCPGKGIQSLQFRIFLVKYHPNASLGAQIIWN